MGEVVDINEELSYERMLEELPEATPVCPRCEAPEGGLCKDPGCDCPYGCEPIDA
jgi:hypothetical protein